MSKLRLDIMQPRTFNISPLRTSLGDKLRAGFVAAPDTTRVWHQTDYNGLEMKLAAEYAKTLSSQEQHQEQPVKQKLTDEEKIARLGNLYGKSSGRG